MLAIILSLFGEYDEISKEQAAQFLMEREVRFMWKPVIVDPLLPLDATLN